MTGAAQFHLPLSKKILAAILSSLAVLGAVWSLADVIDTGLSLPRDRGMLLYFLISAPFLVICWLGVALFGKAAIETLHTKFWKEPILHVDRHGMEFSITLHWPHRIAWQDIHSICLRGGFLHVDLCRPESLSGAQWAAWRLNRLAGYGDAFLSLKLLKESPEDIWSEIDRLAPRSVLRQEPRKAACAQSSAG